VPPDPASQSPTPAGAAAGDEPSWIAQERVGPGLPPLAYWAWISAAAFAVVVGGFVLADRLAGPLAAEEQARASGTPFGALFSAMSVAAGRSVSAVVMGLGVFAAAEAARRLLHSPLAGALAAALLVLEPSTWVLAETALPAAWSFAGVAAGLAIALTAWPAAPWLAAVPLSVAASADPRTLWLGAAVALLLGMRGHIYSSARHAGVAFLGAVGIPAAVAVVAAALAAGRAGAGVCSLPWLRRSLLLDVQDLGGDVILAHNPVVWYGGAAAAVLLGAAAAARVASGFRMTRQPGRTMFRLPGRLARDHGRALWVLGLALAAVAPGAFVPVAAIALAAGVGRLGKDATGFAVPLHLAVAVFSAVYLVRLWPFVVGAGGDIAEALLPWVQAVPCAA
jgi:hypothetical protein